MKRHRQFSGTISYAIVVVVVVEKASQMNCIVAPVLLQSIIISLPPPPADRSAKCEKQPSTNRRATLLLLLVPDMSSSIKLWKRNTTSTHPEIRNEKYSFYNNLLCDYALNICSLSLQPESRALRSDHVVVGDEPCHGE